MTVLLRGKPVADAIYARIQAETERFKELEGVGVKLAVVVVAGDPATAYYVQAKRKVAERVGVAFEVHEFESSAREEEVVACIKRLNEDAAVHGIMLELPLPAAMSANRVASIISPYKDVDGVTPTSKQALLTGERALLPATPQACIRLAKHYGFVLAGASVALVGRGQTVGMPLFHLLQREQATVTVCHSRTLELGLHVGRADIVFAAVGSAGLITREMIRPEHVVVDAGMNELPDGTMAGDVAREAGERAAAYSPTPGGVGTVTTAILFENVLKAYEWQRELGNAGDDEQVAWLDRPIRRFLEESSAAVPTPGGGSVAALVGALGASMASMAAGFSQGPKYADWAGIVSGALARLAEASLHCEDLLEADIVSFERYRAAAKLPRDTEEQKAARRHAIEKTTLEAIAVPLQLMEVCRDASRIAEELAPCANKNVISDLGIGSLLFEAAARSAYLTVEINLAAMAESDTRTELARRADALLEEIEELKKKAIGIVKERIRQ
ncbi:cyclodeaminase/cyclohydrolase family protein [Paenibacillus koleovorans]|uniref:cyclodeaminase/cyclohydrolase family protein n=1 Tax=Paenibacillus koleovorans TaxID=121608 RepID=UPI0013E35800|nr:cyclodeaminase/cyclohydrolase family protein [Paenibacillus koleovorans]